MFTIQPLSLSAIYKKAWRAYSKIQLNVLIVAIITSVVTLFPLIFFPNLISTNFKFVEQELRQYIAYFPGHLFLLVYILNVMTLCVAGAIFHNHKSFLQCLLLALIKLPYVIIAFIFYAACVMLGFVALIIPGIFLIFSLSQVILLILLQDNNPINALKNSYKIVHGHWWKVFGVLFPLYLLYLIGSIIIDLIFKFSIGMEFITHITFPFVLFLTCLFIFNLFFIPFFYYCSMSLFSDLVIRAQEQAIL